MDPETIARLVSEHPERYRGGMVDRESIGHLVSADQAWDRARRNLDDDHPAGAAYWVGWAQAS